MIDALEAEGMLARLRDRDLVLLGTTVLDLAAAVRPERLLNEAARGPLEELVRQTGETATLSVRRGNLILCLQEAAGSHLIGPTAWLGRSWPLQRTASGMLAFAAMPEDELAARLAGIDDAGAIRESLPLIRSRGWALSVDQLEVGLTSIAGPVASTPLEAFVGVSGPTYRFTDGVIDAAARATVAAAAAIAAALRS